MNDATGRTVDEIILARLHAERIEQDEISFINEQDDFMKSMTPTKENCLSSEQRTVLDIAFGIDTHAVAADDDDDDAYFKHLLRYDDLVRVLFKFACIIGLTSISNRVHGRAKHRSQNHRCRSQATQLVDIFLWHYWSYYCRLSCRQI